MTLRLRQDADRRGYRERTRTRVARFRMKQGAEFAMSGDISGACQWSYPWLHQVESRRGAASTGASGSGPESGCRRHQAEDHGPPAADPRRTAQLQEHRRVRRLAGAALVPRWPERLGKEQLSRRAPLRRRLAPLLARPCVSRPRRDQRGAQAIRRSSNVLRDPRRVQPRRVVGVTMRSPLAPGSRVGTASGTKNAAWLNAMATTHTSTM